MRRRIEVCKNYGLWCIYVDDALHSTWPHWHAAYTVARWIARWGG